MDSSKSKDYDDLANRFKNMAEGKPEGCEEDGIRQLVSACAFLYGLTPDDEEEVVKRVLTKVRHRMSGGVAISAEEHVPWYYQARLEMEHPLEIRCLEYLSQKGLSKSVVNKLDNWTSHIMDFLGDPRKGEFFRKGLVMGDVQSGKTNTYLLLCNKAADAGYKVIVILTTNIENLRVQTQRRVDYTMVGLDSDNMLSNNNRTRVGVGMIDDTCLVQPFTSQAGDFSRSVAERVSYQVWSPRMDPCVFVVKKENKTLKNLYDWLANNCDSGKMNQSLLMIDDEADYASVNTKKEDASRINSRIKGILGMFTRASYCGFTATPFANIFIDPDKSDDLFPSDFIYCMGRSDNYIGPDKLFSGEDFDDSSDSPYPRMIQVIRYRRYTNRFDRQFEGLDELKLKHEKTDVMRGMPESLRTAIYEFLLTCAIRDLRGDSHSHMSMMINMSRFTDVQNNIGVQVDDELKDIVKSVNLFAKMDDVEEALKNRRLSDLHRVFEEQYYDCGFIWPAVMRQLHSSVQPVKVMTVNQASPEPIRYKDAPMRVIAIGGNSLSRGLTLEGLVVSYFYRNSKTYDTLMQMGRWFGYHDGYEDLCRVWMSEESIEWYTYINRATENLREQFYVMAKKGKTPREFGLLVENDLTTLDITARNKMYSAGGVEYIVKSVAGKMIDTVCFYADPKNVAANHKAVSEAIDQIEASGIEMWHNPETGNYVWRDVPREFVSRLISRSRIPDGNLHFDQEMLVDQISDDTIDSLSRWDVAVVSKKKRAAEEMPPFRFREDRLAGRAGIEVNMPVRTKVRQLEDDFDALKVMKGKLITPSDVAEGLYRADGTYDTDLRGRLEREFREQVRADDEDKDRVAIRETAYLTPKAEGKRPLLLIYFINIFEKVEDQDDRVAKKAQDLEGLPPVGMAIAYPSSGDLGDSQSKISLKYRANKIYERQRNEFLLEDDERCPEWRSYASTRPIPWTGGWTIRTG